MNTQNAKIEQATTKEPRLLGIDNGKIGKARQMIQIKFS